jgi:exopolyphosphatase/guanosine-5'-triphosphate,3'-diphosphate pyrophosphatase
MARQWDAPEPLAFATAVVRDAPDRANVLRAVHSRTGLRLRVLPGEAEARLTFLGARRWMGRRSGPPAVFDIGGGSLEVAFGPGRTPEFAASLPLGANRLTREFFGSADPPSPSDVVALRRKVRHQLRDVSARIRWEHPQTAVATSRAFQQLARLCGSWPGCAAPLRDVAARSWSGPCADVTCAGRPTGWPRCPSPSGPGCPASPRPGPTRVWAGAVVGHAAMKLSDVKIVTICPWALREGVLLRYLEDGADWWADLGRQDGLARRPERTVVRCRRPGPG